jgi:hypothetical protein
MTWIRQKEARMRRLIAHVTALTAIALVLTVVAVKATPERATGLKAIHFVDVNRTTTWGCQDELHVARRPSRFLERHTRSARYRWWLATFWGGQRSYYCGIVDRQKTLLQRADQDFERALRLASNVYGVSYSWLHSCAGSEGGFRGWIPNHSGSGAGGWMQFLAGTFYANVDGALTYARPRVRVSLGAYRSWYSRVGQAFTAAHMFRSGESSQWTGAGC